MKGQIRQLALLGLAISLASCAATDSVRQTASANPSRDSTAAQSNRSNARSSQVSESLGNVLVDEADNERQALIDEINSDGVRRGLSRYQEVVPSPVQPPSDDVVALNYEQADLRDILTELADALDISMMIDPSIDDRVSLRTAENRPLSYQDIWPLVRLLVQQHGIVLERVGNIWHARRGTGNIPVEIATPETLDTGTAAVIMQVTPLVYVSAASVIEILNPLLEPDGRVIEIGNSNTLAVTAGRSQLQRINELLNLIDDNPFRNQGIQLFPLSNALASDVGEELADILALIEGPTPAYQVQALDRINALLVTAPAARGFNEISRWIRILDADREEQAEQLFQYRVKNLNATDLATTLTEVFRIEENTPQSSNNSEAPNQSGSTPVLFLDQTGEAIGRARQLDSPAPEAAASDIAVSANLRVSIVADEPTNSLLIRANPRDYRQLLATINQLDTAPLQVMISAVIAQIVLTDDTSFGVDWTRVLENATSGSVNNVSTGFLPDSGDGTSGLGGLLFTRAFLDGAARVEATLEAIAINNDVRLLARPSLTVINNQEGLIRIGAEVPVQLGETVGVGGSATTNIQYRPTGIELQITPRINDDGVVNLTIRQELSSVSGSSGVNQNPIFQNQEIETTVVVRDGENVVLGGLIQNANDQLNTGVPYLNRVPGLGRLFSYQQDNNERRELFIVIRPEIVNLNDQNEARYREVVSRFELAARLVEDF